ncbi:MAG: heme oxygenase (biliverdin-producing) [Yaniella sp.]|uniref:biliverdin-producing heme oxygenase n=1 Tax=Yaniella sp. TaxID=2773929 RepID=UPI003F973D73
MPHPEESSTLAARVKALTAEDHKSAETVPFITELMSGKRSKRDYALLVGQYYYMYNALDHASEQLRESTSLSGVSALLDPLLDRRIAIQNDLEALLPEVGLRQEPVLLDATADYVKRIQDVANDAPRLTAHHYLRYLGDLSGGLAIARLVQRHYGISSEQLNMYTFDSISKPKLYKDAYRDQLNNMGLSSAQEEVFIQEATLGFHLNKAIFEELGKFSDSLTSATA